MVAHFLITFLGDKKVIETYNINMIRKNDLDPKNTSVRSKKSSKKTVTYADGSGHEDIVLAKRRGVFGMALIFLAILLLVVII